MKSSLLHMLIFDSRGNLLLISYKEKESNFYTWNRTPSAQYLHFAVITCTNSLQFTWPYPRSLLPPPHLLASLPELSSHGEALLYCEKHCQLHQTHGILLWFSSACSVPFNFFCHHCQKFREVHRAIIISIYFVNHGLWLCFCGIPLKRSHYIVSKFFLATVPSSS